jgi:hypothetical protein
VALTPVPSGTPPATFSNEKKGGLGCWGIGCLIVGLITFLLVFMAGSVAFVVWNDVKSLTSSEAMTVPSFDGGDDMYQTTEQKLKDFDHDLNSNQPSKIELSGDEINTMISRNPDLAKYKVHLFVTLKDDEAEVQRSVSTNFVADALKNHYVDSMLKDRYFNGDVSFGLDFNSDDKTIHLKLRKLYLANQNMSESSLSAIETQVNAQIDQAMLTNADFKRAMQRAKSVQIQNGELTIETE